MKEALDLAMSKQRAEWNHTAMLVSTIACIAGHKVAPGDVNPITVYEREAAEHRAVAEKKKDSTEVYSFANVWKQLKEEEESEHG